VALGAVLTAFAAWACGSFGVAADAIPFTPEAGAVDARPEAAVRRRFCAGFLDAGFCADFDDEDDPLQGWTQASTDIQADYGIGPGASPPNAARLTLQAGPDTSPDTVLRRNSAGSFRAFELSGKVRLVAMEPGHFAQMLTISFPNVGVLIFRSDGRIIERRDFDGGPSHTTIGDFQVGNDWTEFTVAVDLSAKTLRFSFGDVIVQTKPLSIELRPGGFIVNIGLFEPNGALSLPATILFDDVVLRGTRQ
jgi:hypothetical protein